MRFFEKKPDGTKGKEFEFSVEYPDNEIYVIDDKKGRFIKDYIKESKPK